MLKQQACYQTRRTSNYSVGPPDPRSNIRLVSYDESPSSADAKQQEHPYSLREFTKSKMDYQLKSERQRLDMFNHEFWADSNTRFENEKQDVSARISETATLAEREVALSDFYRRWLLQEEQRQASYTRDWRSMNWNEILLTARVEYRSFKARWASRFSRTPL